MNYFSITSDSYLIRFKAMFKAEILALWRGKFSAHSIALSYYNFDILPTLLKLHLKWFNKKEYKNLIASKICIII